MEKIDGIPVYDIVFDSSFNLGITAISLVEKPAIEIDFLAFSEDNRFIKFVSEEKMEIVSPVLIPDKLIYRVDDNGNPFYVKFSKETIDELAWNFLLNGRCSNVNIGHPTTSANDAFDNLLEGVECIDLWIIEGDNDKAYDVFKFSREDLPEGTLMINYKVNDIELWREIRSNNSRLRGLSVELFTGIGRI